jgi:hypothetical protein
MVATPEVIQPSEFEAASSGDSKVAVLLMGYGEVESYEDFANYNEQALNLLTAKFAPCRPGYIPPWLSCWRRLICMSGATSTTISSLPTMQFLSSNGQELKPI